jgi:hypothetical protein
LRRRSGLGFNPFVRYRRTPRVEARLSASRERILSGAPAIVAERGDAGCPMAAVAREAGVATGSAAGHLITFAQRSIGAVA